MYVQLSLDLRISKDYFYGKTANFTVVLRLYLDYNPTGTQTGQRTILTGLFIAANRVAREYWSVGRVGALWHLRHYVVSNTRQGQLWFFKVSFYVVYRKISIFDTVYLVNIVLIFLARCCVFFCVLAFFGTPRSHRSINLIWKRIGLLIASR